MASLGFEYLSIELSAPGDALALGGAASPHSPQTHRRSDLTAENATIWTLIGRRLMRVNGGKHAALGGTTIGGPDHGITA